MNESNEIIANENGTCTTVHWLRANQGMWKMDACRGHVRTFGRLKQLAVKWVKNPLALGKERCMAPEIHHEPC